MLHFQHRLCYHNTNIAEQIYWHETTISLRSLSSKHSYHLQRVKCKFKYLHAAFLYGSFLEQL